MRPIQFLFPTGFLLGILLIVAFCVVNKHKRAEIPAAVKEVAKLNNVNNSNADLHRKMPYVKSNVIKRQVSEYTVPIDPTPSDDDAVCVEQNCRQDAWMMIMRFGSSEEKIDAFNTLANMLYVNGNDASTIESLVQNDGMPETGSIRELLLFGIGDNDDEVASSAFNLLKLLPEEDRGIVMSRAISDDNPLCRIRLLSDISQNTDNLSITTMMHALDDSNEEIKETASRLLESKLAVRFSSCEEAFSWWEENAAEFNRLQASR